MSEIEQIDNEREDALKNNNGFSEDQSDYDGDQFDLDARLSLTRVPGMSTDLSDISEVEYRQLRLERVVLCSVWTQGTAADAENAMAELKALAETAGSQVLEAVMQHRTTPDPATYIGSGKVAELAEVVWATGADTVICDGELDAAQLRNLEDRVKVKVVDRTALILDIFAQHARSVEGRTQVELAQLNYLKQRLRGWGGNLSRQTGGRAAGGAGIGGRGPGETRIETDRRRISHRIAVLRRRLTHIESTRASKRADRIRNKVPSVAIVGYTNAGKSSLLNRLTRAGVLVENALFATLDPRLDAPPPPTVGSTPSLTRWDLFDTCRTTSSRPLHLLWRRRRWPMCSSTLWMQMIQIHSARSTQYAGCCRGLGPVIFLRFSSLTRLIVLAMKPS
ncbi:GTP-binding protein HflX [Cutibacterium acnes JCM 18918]|nr:GTP-binding protein HflX [Cutibacterium acnes JCM 18918]